VNVDHWVGLVMLARFGGASRPRCGWLSSLVALGGAGARWHPIGGGNDLTRKVSLGARPLARDIRPRRGGAGLPRASPTFYPTWRCPMSKQHGGGPGSEDPLGDRTPHGRTSPWDSHVRGDPRSHGVTPYSPAFLSIVKSRSPPRIGMVKIA